MLNTVRNLIDAEQAKRSIVQPAAEKFPDPGMWKGAVAAGNEGGGNIIQDLPALYVTLVAMLPALIFRGVAFEFRWRTERWRAVWDVAFIWGSGIGTLAQGIKLGALLQGIQVVWPTGPIQAAGGAG